MSCSEKISSRLLRIASSSLSATKAAGPAMPMSPLVMVNNRQETSGRGHTWPYSTAAVAVSDYPNKRPNSIPVAPRRVNNHGSDLSNLATVVPS